LGKIKQKKIPGKKNILKKKAGREKGEDIDPQNRRIMGRTQKKVVIFI